MLEAGDEFRNKGLLSEGAVCSQLALDYLEIASGVLISSSSVTAHPSQELTPGRSTKLLKTLEAEPTRRSSSGYSVQRTALCSSA